MIRVKTVHSVLWIELIHALVQDDTRQGPDATHCEIAQCQSQEEWHELPIATNTTLLEYDPFGYQADE